MLQRLLSSVLVTCFAATAAHAAARVPQVPVSGTALATFFQSRGEHIEVNGQQLDLQVATIPVGWRFEAHMFGPQVGLNSFGTYNSANASPPLYQIFPGGALGNWFAVAEYRSAPARMVVEVVDGAFNPMGFLTYVGADPTNFGVYVQTNDGTVFYTQDARNPGGATRILAYNSSTFGTWFACETGAGPDGDFADCMVHVALPLAPSPVPVNRSSWGRIKQLFH